LHLVVIKKNILKQKGETLATISYKTFECQHAIVHVYAHHKDIGIEGHG
jgi:hypothetical protein